MLDRRGFLFSAAAAASSPSVAIDRIERLVVWKGREGGVTWFHPRACAIPARGQPRLFMTLQSISGSDVYGPVHWSESRDLGLTWTTPAPIPGMGRRQHPDGIEEGFCDTVPEHHARTGAVLAIAQNVYYKDNRLTRPNELRWPVYIVRSRDGRWSQPRKLEWDNPQASAIYVAGCAQRITLGSGEILIPLSFGPLGREDRAVASALCSFDGRELKIRRSGDELRLAVKRGLLEPSLAFHAGRYYMTIRAEDGRGYATASADGMQWAPIRAWCWDDGEPLVLSTTQQRWLTHSDGLFLVYTRRSPANVNVTRWRAPLYVARVDIANLTLVRASERIVLPMSGDGVNAPDTVAHLGNFHTTPVNAGISLITAGEVLPQRGFRGDTLAARIHWSRPNREAL